MFRKKDPGNSPKVEQSVAKAVSYEITVADMARRSERRAWWVATGSLLMSLALAGGYYYMLPLKEKVPFLVMADAYTGTATVARLSGTFQGETITTNEAINRSNVVLPAPSPPFSAMTSPGRASCASRAPSSSIVCSSSTIIRAAAPW